MYKGLQFIVFVIFGILYYCCNSCANASNCNEYVCGSVVSKCLLTQSCQCKLSDCTCCKDCFSCLGGLFLQCCSCLDMCPKHNDTLIDLTLKSQIGDFEGLPELFDTLTFEENAEQWTMVSFPVRSQFKPHYGGVSDAIDRQTFRQETTSRVNCTVVYLNTCISSTKCAQHCSSMGANSFRWFHDGCCECVGSHCYNYGINESRCKYCPEDDEEDLTLDGADDDDGDDGDDATAAEEDNENMMWEYDELEMNFN